MAVNNFFGDQEIRSRVFGVDIATSEPLASRNDPCACALRSEPELLRLNAGLYHVELGDGRQRYAGAIVFE